MAKTNITIWNLKGQAANIRMTAECIADCKYTNAYVMGLDDEGEPLWTIQSGSDKDDFDQIDLTSSKLAAVEYYDYATDGEICTEKWEQVWVRAGKRGQSYLEKYFSRRDESLNEGCFEYGFIENQSNLKVEEKEA